MDVLARSQDLSAAFPEKNHIDRFRKRVKTKEYSVIVLYPDHRIHLFLPFPFDPKQFILKGKTFQKTEIPSLKCIGK